MNCISTHSGKEFCFLEPENYDFEIEEIAHALSNICRFTGQCKDFYSVAQHSVFVAELAGFYASHMAPEADLKLVKLAALLHDASEAFLGDVSTPLKMLISDYMDIEIRVQDAISKHFLNEKWRLVRSPPILRADNVALHIEAAKLMPHASWIDPEAERILRDTKGVCLKYLDHILVPLPPGLAFDLFITKYKELTNGR